MERIEGGVTAAKGFQAAATAAGIKYQDRADMAMVYSKTPCSAAGTFTSNLVKAAPVLWDQAIVAGDAPVHAVVVNAGIANASTGKDGMEACQKTAAAAAEKLGLQAEREVLVASTGVIGMQLPVEKLVAGIDAMKNALAGNIADGHLAARAIMTTDTMPKEAAVRFEIGGKTVTLGGMCKGSGMIHPDMCTMLCFLTTDCAISKALLQEALSQDVCDTYNMISVDGDTSTNDTCLLLANGEAENPKITEKNEDYALFCKALREVNGTLAQMMAKDGEGATALLTMKVTGAGTKEQAKRIARSVVSSNLVKAAIYGHDANCGRVLCAMGYAGAPYDPDKVEVFYESSVGRIRMVENGTMLSFDEELAEKILSEPEVTVIADLHEGKAEATAWGCDLTHEYVNINADYRS
ncbi:MAG: bifunctional glutamate N-acetyltransferase/amino-acid acetyltransferase ArgJ [Lachnospiraceae bacterium]|nr:bifunctional glutamate N-acetyltransferase/amino-acid acetyltransferase ArgJ [Lachnospiraceae bacterium]